MNVLTEIFMGMVLSAIFWGNISKALLDFFKTQHGTYYTFAVSAFAFCWGYILHLLTDKRVAKYRQIFVIIGWMLPIFIFTISIICHRTNPETFTELSVYAAFWTLTSAHGINYARTAQLFTAQRTALLGTVILAALASFTRHGGLAVGTLFFVLMSSLNITLFQQQKVFKTTLSKPMNYWTISGAVISIISLLLAVFLSFNSQSTLVLASRLGNVIWNFAQTIIIYAFVPVAWAVEWLILRLRQILKWTPFEGEEAEPFFNGPLEKIQERNELSQVPGWFSALLAAAALLLFLWLIWRLFIKSYAKRARHAHVTETRENLLKTGAFNRWAENAGAEMAAQVKQNVAKFLKAVRLYKPRTIEELYFYSLEAVGKQIFPRKSTSTPLEYLGAVVERIPRKEGQEALGYITKLFCKYYYSNSKPGTLEWEKGVHAYRILTQQDTFRPVPPDQV